MNLVGKIFVFLIFCMSLVFASFAVLIYATHINWRDEVTRETAGPGQKLGWEMRLENQQKLNDALRSQKKDLEDQIATLEAAHRQRIAKLEQEKERLLAAEQLIAAKYAEVVAAHKTALTAVENSQNRLKNLSADHVILQKQIVDARAAIDAKYDAMLVLAEQNHLAKGEVDRLEERRKQIIADLTKAEEVLKKNKLSKDTPIDDVPPTIGGIVARVKKVQDDIYVEVTVGSDDGLLKGHDMEVYRGGKYLGRIKIVRTTPDRAVGKVDRKIQQGEIMPRDRVETRRGLKLTAG